MLGRISDVEKLIQRHMDECKGIKTIKAYMNKLKQLDKKVNKMESGNVTVERWEISKLIIVSLIVPLLNGLGFILSEWLNFGIWSWIPLVIVINSISIPTIVAWLTKKFDKKELAMEVSRSALKDTHNKEVSSLKDEIQAERINTGIARAELKLIQDKLDKLEV